MKRCCRCEETKPLSEFNKQTRRPDGLNPACRPCDKMYQRLRRYRLTKKQYDIMWEMQDGECASCSTPMLMFGTEGTSSVVDHDHDTGAVRALLCSSCNKALGLLNENVSRAVGLANYIREYCNEQSD